MLRLFEIASSFVLARKYHDAHSGSIIAFVGTVTNGGSFPILRPDGTGMAYGDYVLPSRQSTFPFTIKTVTFTSIKDKAIYAGQGNWTLEPGQLQDTRETGLYDAEEESMSGESENQSELNVEVREYIEQWEFSFSTAAATWTVEHDLGKYPSVVCLDGGSNTIVGAVTYVNENTLTVSFDAAQSGKAIIN